MKQIIHKLYEAGTVTGRSGEVHKIHSAIDRDEGEFLFNIIDSDPKVTKTLEVGCAYGLSSLHICMATRSRAGASHTIIDPFQNSQWDGVGTKNLEDSGIGFFELLEVKSEFALPRILEKSEGQFDFVFIDGNHTLDHALLDCFYATRLLRVGGYLAIDDANFASVGRVVSFLKNYPCYEEYGSVSDDVSKSWKKTIARHLMSPIHRKAWARLISGNLYRRIFEDLSVRLVALKKTSEDSRAWNWHVDTF